MHEPDWLIQRRHTHPNISHVQTSRFYSGLLQTPVRWISGTQSTPTWFMRSPKVETAWETNGTSCKVTSATWHRRWRCCRAGTPAWRPVETSCRNRSTRLRSTKQVNVLLLFFTVAAPVDCLLALVKGNTTSSSVIYELHGGSYVIADVCQSVSQNISVSFDILGSGDKAKEEVIKV